MPKGLQLGDDGGVLVSCGQGRVLWHSSGLEIVVDLDRSGDNLTVREMSLRPTDGHLTNVSLRRLHINRLLAALRLPEFAQIIFDEWESKLNNTSDRVELVDLGSFTLRLPPPPPMRSYERLAWYGLLLTAHTRLSVTHGRASEVIAATNGWRSNAVRQWMKQARDATENTKINIRALSDEWLATTCCASSNQASTVRDEGEPKDERPT